MSEKWYLYSMKKSVRKYSSWKEVAQESNPWLEKSSQERLNAMKVLVNRYFIFNPKPHPDARPFPNIYPIVVGNAKRNCIKMKAEMKLNVTPTRFDLEKIEEWLIEEERELNEGFYCNWKTIEKAFNNDELITLKLKEQPIGFLVWSKGEIYAEIDILEIKPNHQQKGIGKAFFEQISDYFKQKGFLVIKLFCSPRESEKFWKKMGFIKFPVTGYSESDLTYFKPLIRIQSTSENPKTDNTVELWDVEPYQKNNNQPKWTWNIELENDKLKLPILQPCNCNWNLRWSKKGEVIRENKVKYFDIKKNRVEYSPFLYIESLIQ